MHVIARHLHKNVTKFKDFRKWNRTHLVRNQLEFIFYIQLVTFTFVVHVENINIFSFANL